MRINKADTHKTVLLSTIEAGQCFEYCKDLYIKTSQSVKLDKTVYCINLATGAEEHFSLSQVVYLVNASLSYTLVPISEKD